LIFKEINVKNAIYTIVFTVFKSTIIALSLTVFFSLVLTGKEDVVEFIPGTRDMIVHFDVANAYGIVYGIAAVLSYVISESLFAKLGFDPEQKNIRLFGKQSEKTRQNPKVNRLRKSIF
jgi:hypothetical protein